MSRRPDRASHRLTFLVLATGLTAGALLFLPCGCAHAGATGLPAASGDTGGPVAGTGEE